MIQNFKTIALLVAILSTVMISGCGKGQENTSRVKTKIVRSNTYLYQSDSLTYTYDERGRLVAMQGVASISTFAYADGKVTQTDNFNRNTVYTLNSKGYAVSDSRGNSYTYDSKGMLILQIQSSGDTLIKCNTENGDIITSKVYLPYAVSDTFTYTDIGETRTFGYDFLGSKGAHLPKSLAKYGRILGYNAFAITYEFDSKGRVSEETMTSRNAIAVKTTYTYTE
jgi:hypothetical protein